MDSYNIVDVAQNIIDLMKKEQMELKRINVMVLGKTGVGKSTLINNMFGEKLAATGRGKPVTSKITKHTIPDYPLAIYDTPGLELSGDNDVDELLNDAFHEIKKGFESNDISNCIHCIWYCVSVPSNRFEQAEIDFLNRLVDNVEEYNVPIIIVLTQAYSKNAVNELIDAINKENLRKEGVVPVLSEDFCIDEYTKKAYGLNELSKITHDAIKDENIKKTFVAIQIANIELKKKNAHKVVTASTAAAIATCAIPIPIADSVLLVPEQVAMLAKITSVFGLSVEKRNLLGIISATIGTTGATVLGKTVVSSILKAIPYVGSVVGGAISGAAAGAITAALGEAYIAILVKVCKGEIQLSDLSTKAGKEVISKFFIEQLKQKRKEDGSLEMTEK